MCVFTVQLQYHSRAYHAESAMLLCVSIGVCAVWKKAGIIAVNHVVDVVLGEQLGQEVGSQVIWDSCKGMQISWVAVPAVWIHLHSRCVSHVLGA